MLKFTKRLIIYSLNKYLLSQRYVSEAAVGLNNVLPGAANTSSATNLQSGRVPDLVALLTHPHGGRAGIALARHRVFVPAQQRDHQTLTKVSSSKDLIYCPVFWLNDVSVAPVDYFEEQQPWS